MAKYLPPEGYILDETTGLYVSETKITDISGNTMTMVMTFDADTGEFKQKMAEPAVAEPEEPAVAEPEAPVVEPGTQGGLKPPPPIPAAMINPAAPPVRLQSQPATPAPQLQSPSAIPAPPPLPAALQSGTPVQAVPVRQAPPPPPIPAAMTKQAPPPPPVQSPVQQPPVQSALPVQQLSTVQQQRPPQGYNQYAQPNHYMQPNNFVQPAPKKKGKGGAIAVIVIAACLVLGLGVFAVIKFTGNKVGTDGGFAGLFNKIDRDSTTTVSSSSTSADTDKKTADTRTNTDTVNTDEYGINQGLIEILVHDDKEADFVFHGDKANGTDLRWLSFFTGKYLITAFDSDNDDIKEIQEVGIYMQNGSDYKYVGHAEYYIDGDDFVICADSLIVPDLDFTRLSSWGKLDYGYYDGTEFSAECDMNKYAKNGSYSFSKGVKSDEQKAADLFGGTGYATEDEYYEQEYYDSGYSNDYYEEEYYEGPKLTNVTVPASHYCGIFYCDDFDTFDRASAPTIALYENGTFEIYANFMEGFCSYCGEFSVEQKGSDIYVNLFNYDALNGVPTTATIKFSANDPDYLWFLDPGFGVMGYRFGDGPFGFYRDMRG